MSMQNAGYLDRMVRLVIGLVLFWVASRGMVTGAPAVAAYVVAAAMVLTAAFGFCPLYRLLGIDTCSAPPRHARN